MTITKQQNGAELVILLEGRLDTTTAPELERELQNSLNGITELTLDFTKLQYLSSAGLRVLLKTQKQMAKQGHLTITHVCPDILDVFEITGFLEVLDVQ